MDDRRTRRATVGGAAGENGAGGVVESERGCERECAQGGARAMGGTPRRGERAILAARTREQIIPARTPLLLAMLGHCRACVRGREERPQQRRSSGRLPSEERPYIKCCTDRNQDSA